MSKARSDLVLKLREIFRSDRSDLDFGIYKILNLRRNEINDYIENQIVKKAEEEFEKLTQVEIEIKEQELVSLRNEINRDFGADTITDKGIVTRNHESPKIKLYSELQKSFDENNEIELQINDVFNHVYEFFNRYYDKGDFISQRRYGGREKYVIPYNGEEVSLYWANQDQYYVKTTEDYYKFSFYIGEIKIVFKLVLIEDNYNYNVNEDRFFHLIKDNPIEYYKDNHILEIKFEHRPIMEEEYQSYDLTPRSRLNTKKDTIINHNHNRIRFLLNEMDLVIDDKLLLLRIKEYNDKNDMDYFLHKNLTDFLKRELDFYIKTEIIDMSEWITNDDKHDSLLKNKINAIKSISEEIIYMLGGLENYQLKLFEKKKFILNTNYLITLDMIPKKLYSVIGSNKVQISEWKKEYNLDDISKGTLFDTNNLDVFDETFLSHYKLLPIDTKNFSNNFKYELLSCLDNIDDSLNGVLINSENYQALNLIQKKYKNKIKTIYIDPPYNTENTDFPYKDKFKHSSWLSMMYDRITMGKSMLKDNGLYYISIDENEKNKLDILCKQIFKLKLGEIIVHRKRGRDNSARDISKSHDYLLAYGNGSESTLGQLEISDSARKAYRNPDKDPRGPYRTLGLWARGTQSGSEYAFTLKDGYHLTKRLWLVSKKTMEDYEKEDRLIRVNDNLYRKLFLSEHEGTVSDSIWLDVSNNANAADEIKNEFGSIVFDTTKPYPLIKRIIELSNTATDYVMDYFAGSGATANAILLMKRLYDVKTKYILIEMGDYFDDVLLKRIKKKIFSDEWKDGLAIKYNGVSQFVKYQYIEQFEDTLNNIWFESKDGTVQTTLTSSSLDFINYILKKGGSLLLNLNKFNRPFEYRINTIQNKEEVEMKIDLIETFNYLLGINVKKIKQINKEETKYIFIYGQDEKKKENVIIIWRDFDESILEEEKTFIENEIIPELYTDKTHPLKIYINVESYVQNASSIEPTFNELMGLYNA